MKKLILTAILLATPGLAAAQAVNGRQYVRMAGASDSYEIQSSRLVLATTRNPGVRRFAAAMIRDHSKSTADVKRAARRAGIVPMPPRLNAMQARDLAQLRRARGPARDALYIQQQKAAHQMALDLQRDYAARGDVRPLAATASTIVPVVQHHIGELRRM